MPAAVLYDNLADRAAVSASTSLILAPPERVQDVHVARRWRSLTAADHLVMDFGAAVSMDTVAALGLSATSARLRLSSVDQEEGDLFDSGAGDASQPHRQAVWLLPAPVSARFARIDFVNAGGAFVEAGRIVAGLRSAFEINFDYGWGFSYGDLSKKARTRGGQTQVNRDDRYRMLDLTFSLISKADRYEIVDTIDRINGLSTDVLFVADPDSDDLARDTIWGLITETTPVIQPYFDRFSKTYRIEERL